MKNATNTLAVIAVLAAALAGMALTASSPQTRATSIALRKQPMVDEIIPQDTYLAFNWGISNKVIRPKRILAYQSRSSAPTDEMLYAVN